MLDLARPLVKPGGRLVYVTCSVLPEENIDQVDAFLARGAGLPRRAVDGSLAPAARFGPRLDGDERADTAAVAAATARTFFHRDLVRA